jgi:excisionase family DNA binding protein
LRPSNPISRFYIRHYPLPVVRKKEFEFLVEVADCLPPCLEFLIKTPMKKQIDTGDSRRVVDETNGRRLLTAKEAGRKLNKKASTIRYWARKNRIAAEFTQDKSGRKRLLGIPASAVDAYLAAKARSSKR